MKFMVIVYPGDREEYEAGKMPDPALIDAMMKYNEELVDAGIMQAGEGLKPSSQGVRLHFSEGGAPTVRNGPFDPDDLLVGGFWMWDVSSREEALEWAKRAPMENGATLEIRPVFESADFGAEVEEKENRLREKMQRQ